MCCIAFAERAMQGSISSLHRQKRISVGWTKRHLFITRSSTSLLN
jgi:hypothetical protein